MGTAAATETVSQLDVEFGMDIDTPSSGNTESQESDSFATADTSKWFVGVQEK